MHDPRSPTPRLHGPPRDAVQIYNEVIYDLLDPGKKKAGRASLDIKVRAAGVRGQSVVASDTPAAQLARGSRALVLPAGACRDCNDAHVLCV